MRLVGIGYAVAGIVTLSACSASSGGSPSLPALHDVSDAPPAIKTAAEAVVRIGTSGELGTGAFISSNGVLITNNHVLGIDVCPLEGCYVQIDFAFQRHSPPHSSPLTLFATPVAIDAGLDMAVVQITDVPGGTPFATPSHLTLVSHSAASLVGTHVYVVGHPDGTLKKWTEGTVADTIGDWIVSTSFSLPGNSGSPFLDDSGHMVGILHRGPTAQDLGTNTGVDVSSIGTASGSLLEAMSHPLPQDVYSLAGPKTDADVASHQVLFLNGRARDASVNGTYQEVLTSLANQCDAALMQTAFASPADLTSALAPCTAGLEWIDCRSDSTNPFKVCPLNPDDWKARYQKVYDLWISFNGQQLLSTISFGDAALAGDESSGQTVGGQNLVSALRAAKTPLDFTVANYLAAFGVPSYGGKDLATFLKGYAMVPGYGLSGNAIASAMVYLNNAMLVSGSDVTSFLQGLENDPNIDLGAKLYIEEVLYRSGAIP